MPTVSIDTFFACSLIVSVALLATASLAGTMQTRIDSMQNLNKQDYLQTIADQIVTCSGTPVNWGSSGGTAPLTFGLADSSSTHLYALDIDKITRLNSENGYVLQYAEASKAARLTNLALGISVSQMLTIAAELSANDTAGDATAYTFMISVRQDSGPVSASLHCYVVAENFLTDVSNTTSSRGIGYVSFQIPNSSSGAALLIVFARASFDDRLTAYGAYSFGHLAQEPPPNRTFMELSPLNYTLSLSSNSPDVTVDEGYAFSYGYQSNLTATSNAIYAIPVFLDRSPTVLVVSGLNGTTSFMEWAAYPDIPLVFGASFDNSEENVFVYIVTVKETLYRLTISFGDVTT